MNGRLGSKDQKLCSGILRKVISKGSTALLKHAFSISPSLCCANGGNDLLAEPAEILALFLSETGRK